MDQFYKTFKNEEAHICIFLTSYKYLCRYFVVFLFKAEEKQRLYRPPVPVKVSVLRTKFVK